MNVVPLYPRPTETLNETLADDHKIDADLGRRLDIHGFEERYESNTVLGTGGMGQVRLCKDRRIGRSVAMKVVHPRHADRRGHRARIVREACVQGQLEHPSIAPVYDLGRAPDGQVYFTMKRVRGMTLAEIVRKLIDGNEETKARFSQRKLLSAFQTVCLTIDYAHKHGVAHRDLKPSNIMLGDFGEVYVLDWGLAKIVGDDTIETDDIKLTNAAILGTPGYMAPEQIGSPMERATTATDIYALGAMLFEILTLESLHPKGKHAALRSTLDGTVARISERLPSLSVPPELEAICVRATAFVPSLRHRSARDISDAIERYLDGDRNMELRVSLATEHADRAEELTQRALDGRGDEASLREDAMREIGRALALAPEDPRASRCMMRLLTTPPKKMPPDTEAQLEASDKSFARFSAKNGGLAYLCCLAPFPWLLWMGILDWIPVVLAFGLAAVSVFLAFKAARDTDRSKRTFFIRLVVSTLSIMVASRVLGPFLLTPLLATTNTLLYGLNPDKSRRPWTIVIGAIGILLPAILEATGVLQASYVFADGMLSIRPNMVALPEIPVMGYLAVSTVGMLILAARCAGLIRDALSRAEQRVVLTSWHLRRMVSPSKPS